MTTSEGKTEALRERLSSRIPAGGKDGPTQGVNHIAVFAKDLEATAKFYDEILDTGNSGFRQPGLCRVDPHERGHWQWNVVGVL